MISRYLVLLYYL